MSDSLPPLADKTTYIEGANESLKSNLPPENIPTLQERTRGRLATGLLIGLGATLIGTAVYIAFAKDAVGSRELITLVWTSEVTLVSGAPGFYFGSKGN